MLCIMLCIVVMCELQNFHFFKPLFSLVRVRTVGLIRFVPKSFKVRVWFGLVTTKVWVWFSSIVDKVLVRFVRFGFGSFPISSSDAALTVF